MHKYDVLIIGSGLGGLICGAILSKNGYKVCVLEKNRQIGGCLQTFARDKVVFDSGVHYIGGLEKGQNLYQILQYAGIMDKLTITKLDENCFDKIVFDGDEKEYRLAQGHENFVQQLLADFPGEEPALRTYINKIKEVCAKFPLYNLRNGDKSEKDSVIGIDLYAFIDSITTNEKLKQVLLGNNMLYVGQPGKTPLYVHALVQNSYIESAWKCTNGGSQIAKYLARAITANGGEVLKYKEVAKIEVEEEQVKAITTKDGESFTAKHYISNLHPANTLNMLEGDHMRPAYKNRILGLENSLSCFIVNTVVKPGTFPYINHNYYCHQGDNASAGAYYTADNWPQTYALYINQDKQAPHAESVTIMTYMRTEDVAPWANTFNTEDYPAERGATYEAFKTQKAEQLIALVNERFPGFANSVQSYYVATPLSYRDYLGTYDGSMYGVVKDCNDPLRTFIPARTKISNLYLTGQNLNLHGILGVSMTAVLTCAELLGIDYLVDEIRNA